MVSVHLVCGFGSIIQYNKILLTHRNKFDKCLRNLEVELYWLSYLTLLFSMQLQNSLNHCWILDATKLQMTSSEHLNFAHRLPSFCCEKKAVAIFQLQRSCCFFCVAASPPADFALRAAIKLPVAIHLWR